MEPKDTGNEESPLLPAGRPRGGRPFGRPFRPVLKKTLGSGKKPWYLSKAFWTGVAMVILGVKTKDLRTVFDGLGFIFIRQSLGLSRR